MVIQGLPPSDLLQVAGFIYPKLCRPHLEVVGGSHGHAVSTSVMHDQALACCRPLKASAFAQEIGRLAHRANNIKLFCSSIACAFAHHEALYTKNSGHTWVHFGKHWISIMHCTGLHLQ